MPWPRLLVIRIKQIGVIRIDRLVALAEFGQKEGLEEPGRMRPVPLGRTHIRHGLDGLVFGGKRRGERLGPVSDGLVVAQQGAAVSGAFDWHLGLPGPRARPRGRKDLRPGQGGRMAAPQKNRGCRASEWGIDSRKAPEFLSFMSAYNALHGAFTRASGTNQGMLLMLFATLCFVGMQSMIRHVGETLPPFEVAFFRNLFGLVAMSPIFLRQGLRPLKTKKLHLHAARGAIQALGMLAFFTGVTLIPLAQVTALSFSAPLFATLLAILLLGERVRIRRITALVLGFIG